MSFLNDPHQLAVPPTVESEEEDEGPRDYHDFFHDDRPEPGMNYADGGWGFHTQVCRFDKGGVHITIADDCPHFSPEDEMGKVVSKGWTVQQG